MTRFVQDREHKPASRLSAFGDRGDDNFTFDLPAGDSLVRCTVTVMSGGASLADAPAVGATGEVHVTVHWYYDAGKSAAYELEVISSSAGTTTIGPAFLPSRDGFKFNNDFSPHPDRQINVEPFGFVGIGDASNGLCGGMVYAVRDYFEAGIPIPGATNTPESGPLFDYIVNRLQDSFDIPRGPERYAELMAPDLPDHETAFSRHGFGPHGRAWVMIREEWPNIKADLDGGRLSTLGLVCVKSYDLRDLGKNHQVMAYAYDIQGDVVILSIYDPDDSMNDAIRLSFDTSSPEHTTAVSFSRPVNCFFRSMYSFRAPLSESTFPGRAILFEHTNFGGRFKLIESADPDLTASDNGFFNDRVSSLVVLSGHWSFFRDVQFVAPYMAGGANVVLGPGLYDDVTNYNITNDDMSSLKAVS